MTDKHYTHTCQVCKTEFPATLNKDRTPRSRKYLVCSQSCYKVAANLSTGIKRPLHKMKDCAFCGKEFGPLSPRLYSKRIFCTKRCANIKKNKDRGYNIYHRERHCHGCNSPFTRRVRPTKDSGTYCSRECAYRTKKRISLEVAFLRSMASRASKALKYELPEHVVSEIKALRTIAKNISSRIRECMNCGKTHIRRRPFSRMCSKECEAEYRQKAKEAYKQTEAYKKTRRAAKSRRRARIRGAGIAEKIDPIEVFENAKWICHICGDKTLKSKRGTCHDRAPELEHIVAIANGGTHTWSNVACACRKCNIEKGANDYGQMGLTLVGVGQPSKAMPT